MYKRQAAESIFKLPLDNEISVPSIVILSIERPPSAVIVLAVNEGVVIGPAVTILLNELAETFAAVIGPAAVIIFVPNVFAVILTVVWIVFAVTLSTVKSPSKSIESACKVVKLAAVPLTTYAVILGVVIGPSDVRILVPHTIEVSLLATI